jgi:hypothetical protein
MGFSSYADVQAALDRENAAWRAGAPGTSAEGEAARAWWNSQQNVSVPSRPSPPPPPPTPPNPWNTVPTYINRSGIKQAQPDIVIDPETDTSGDYIVERFFEELGGTELISLSRHDLIDGIDVSYKPIANLSRLRRVFNPNNIIALDVLSDNEFSKFSINLLSRGINIPYLDDDGNLIVEIDIIRPQENIEIEISLSGAVTRIEL